MTTVTAPAQYRNVPRFSTPKPIHTTTLPYNSKPGDGPNNLLVLRGLCSLGVLVAHALGMVQPRLADQFAGTWLGALWPTTGLNFVLLFFLHSGYLMGKVFASGDYRLAWPSVRKFYWARFMRIAPLLYFSLAVLILFGGALGKVLAEPWKLVGDLCFLNNFTGRNINAVTWSMSFEMQDYLLCPLWFLIWRRPTAKTIAGCLGASAVLLGWSVYAQHYTGGADLYMMGIYSWVFIAGYAVSLLARRINESSRITGGRWAAWVGFLLFFLASAAYYSITNTIGPDDMAHVEIQTFARLLLVGLGAASLILLELPGSEPALSSRSTAAQLTWLGRISYGVYLWHIPTISAVIASGCLARLAIKAECYAPGGYDVLAGAFTTSATLLIVSILLTVAMSIATFFLVEVRFRPSLYGGS